jgi:hypothetical protein
MTFVFLLVAAAMLLYPMIEGRLARRERKRARDSQVTQD